MDDHEVNEELKKLHQAEFFNAQYYCSWTDGPTKEDHSSPPTVQSS
jgi:hypothetical protein